MIANGGKEPAMETMTTDHPRWKEFYGVLEGPKACDFKQKVEGDPKTTTWKCDNTNTRPFARKALESMGGFDIEASLKYFTAHGGHCDCEILFNVDAAHRRSS